jgi:hypothetical protein
MKPDIEPRRQDCFVRSMPHRRLSAQRAKGRADVWDPRLPHRPYALEDSTQLHFLLPSKNIFSQSPEASLLLLLPAVQQPAGHRTLIPQPPTMLHSGRGHAPCHRPMPGCLCR